MDEEYRIIFTGDPVYGITNVGIFYFDQDGQSSMVEAWEVNPFATISETKQRALQAVLRHQSAARAKLR